MAESRSESIGVTAVKAITYNKMRTSLAIYNNDPAETVYFGFNSQLTTGNGFPINSNGGIAFSDMSGDDPRLEYWLIASAAAVDVRITEQTLKPAGKAEG